MSVEKKNLIFLDGFMEIMGSKDCNEIIQRFTWLLK